MKRLPRTLFRSLLKWNRQPELINNPFTILPSAYGLTDLLPSGITKLDGVEGVQAAIYHCFRHHPDTSANIDLAFTVMKKLNALAVDLKNDLKAQRNHLDGRLATYQIGQVVKHKTTKIRGIVIGWDIVDSKQHVRMLADESDCHELIAKEFTTKLPEYEVEADLQLVRDYQLQRVHNEQIGTYFSHLDDMIGRYVPLQRLAFQYPTDVVDQPYRSILTHAAEVAAAEIALAVVDKQMAQMHEALLAAVDAHFPGIATRADSSAVAGPLQKSRNDIARKILVDILLAVKSMPDKLPGREFKVRLSRGGDLWQANGLAVTTSVDAIRDLNKALSVVMATYQRMGRAVDVIMSIERLAQLRFQTKGQAFVDTLLPAIENKDNVSLSSQMSSDVRQMISRTAHPVACFTTGTIVRHKRFGYRGVVSGYDIRPVVDTTSWEGVKGLARGQEQPFYRVIPDQQNIFNWLGPDAIRTTYYVAQDNLEEVEDMASRIINHPHLSVYFEGYDIDAGRFRVPQQLKYSFPSGDHAFPADYPTTSLLQRWDSLHQAQADERRREEVLVYQTMDHLVVVMRGIIKAALQAMTNDKNALLAALQQAPTKEWALNVENLLWFANVSSPNSDASACMRTGLAAVYRGNMDDANDAIARAIAYDPNLIEAHNKQADLLMHAGDYDAAIAASNTARDIDENHFGGHFGLALAAAKKGNTGQAVDFLREVLDIYPWADKVPSKLQKLLINLGEEDAQDEHDDGEEQNNYSGKERSSKEKDDRGRK